MSRGWHLVYAEDVVVHHHPSPVRNPKPRRSNLTRNALWTAWLRRPAMRALGATCRLGWAAIRDPAALRGFTKAIPGAEWVARQRRPARPPVHAPPRLPRCT